MHVSILHVTQFATVTDRKHEAQDRMFESRVNGYQNNWQREPHVAAMPNGGWIVVYEGYFNNYDSTDVSFSYVAAQRFNADGTRRGTEQVINAIDGTSSGEPSIAVLKNGSYVVTWTLALGDDIFTNGARTYAQVFNADGSARSEIIAADVAPSFRTFAPEVVARGDGGFSLAWGIDASGASFDDVRIRHFSAAGQAISGDQRLNTRVTEFDQLVTRSATLADGRSIVIWGSEASIDDGGAGDNDVRASLIGPAGRVLKSDFYLMLTKGSAGYEQNSGYDVTALANGGFAVVVEDYAFRYDDDTSGSVLMLATYNAAGNRTTLKQAVHVPSHGFDDASLTQLATGEIMITWSTYGPDGGDGRDVFGRLFTASGAPLTEAFRIGVNRFDYDNQETPEVAALAGGGFVVTYMSESIDSDHEGVAMRVYGRGTAGHDVMKVDVTGTVNGLAGNDRLTGDMRANIVNGAWGHDSIYGMGGDDRLIGSRGNDIVNGGTGHDTLTGDMGDDVLLGGFGNDHLTGGQHRNVMNGGPGRDTAAFLGETPVSVRLASTAFQNTGHGWDRLVDIENIVSGRGNDLLIGNGKANRLFGGGGNDRVSGGVGSDWIVGGHGADTLAGHLSTARDGERDTFVFTSRLDSGVGVKQADRIVGFEGGIDKLSLAAIDADPGMAGNQAFDWGGMRPTAHGVWLSDHGREFVLGIDISGDARPDMQVYLNGLTGFGAEDVLL